ncbi:PaaI family thioesterase [Gordonia aurantiaca]|uniref:PaaI family thioesterase n=1 Tax=Gordonia sp. B21 TaxID=3151852 RepID=UPI003264BEB6
MSPQRLSQALDWISGYVGITASRISDTDVRVTAPVDDRLVTDDGDLHPAALFLLLDMAAGLSVGYASLPRWVLTTDISVDFLPAAAPAELCASGRAIHLGGRTGLAEVTVDDGHGTPLAIATANHALVPIPLDEKLPWVDMAVGESRSPDVPDQAECAAAELYRPAPLTDDALVGPGMVAGLSLPMTDHTVNPWGVMHGAVLSHLATAAAGDAGMTDIASMTIRFLRTLETGPAHAIVEQFVTNGPAAHSRIRIVDSASGFTACVAQVRGRTK